MIGRIALAALLLAALYGLGAGESAGAPIPPQINANLNDDCIEGFFWPSNQSVSVTVTDPGGDVVLSKNVSTDGDGHFTVNPVGQLCDVPFDLEPRWKITASDDTTAKVLVLADVTFDDLNPDTDRAAGTAPPGDLFIGIFDQGNGEVDIQNHPGGSWSVDIGSRGGDVQVGSGGDVFSWDADKDATVADRFVTAVSLEAGAPKSRATVVESGEKVLLSGRLDAGDTACVRRQRVSLVKVGGRRREALESDRTDGQGIYSFIRRVKRTTSFRVKYAGGKRCQRAASRVKTVRVAGS